MANSQILDIDTLKFNGSTDKYINLVILGDGYTSSEQIKFKQDADKLYSYLFSQQPWKNYSGYFNGFAIHVVSNESGIKHPRITNNCFSDSVPILNPDTYLGCTFDAYGIHRLVVPQNTGRIADILANNFPLYDQVLILCNTTYYGGSGGFYATSTLNVQGKEICLHELGHSFSQLADEYYAGDDYASEMLNMTQNTDTTTIRWKNWLGKNSIGVYQHCCGGNSSLWYRPHQSCKMRTLGSSFCSVCSQSIIESIHELVNPIVDYFPKQDTIVYESQSIAFNLSKLIKPVPNSLRVSWELNGKIIEENSDFINIKQSDLSSGMNKLIVIVTDSTNMSLIDNHSSIHVNSVSWSIKNEKSTVKITSSQNNFNYSCFPNPTSSILFYSLDLESKCHVIFKLSSLDGKVIYETGKREILEGHYSNSFNIEDLAKGTYLFTIIINETVSTTMIIKN